MCKVKRDDFDQETTYSCICPECGEKIETMDDVRDLDWVFCMKCDSDIELT